MSSNPPTLSIWGDTATILAERNNPFTHLLNDVNQASFPEYPTNVRKILVAFGSIHAATVLVCIPILLVPALGGREARKKHFWFFRKQYVPMSTTPYHIMNSGFVVVISQLVSSLIFIAYIILDYFSLDSTSFHLRAFLHVCWEFCLLPGYFGFHVTAFGSLYTCLCSPRYTAKRRSKFTHPFFLNFVFYTLPVIITMQTLVWGVALAICIRLEGSAYHSLIDYLEIVAEDWVPGHRISPTVQQASFKLFKDYISKGDCFLKCWLWSSRCWTAIGLALAIFYAINVVALLRLLKRCLKAASSPMALSNRSQSLTVDALCGTVDKHKSMIPCVKMRDEQKESSEGLKPSKVTSQPSAKDLRDGYIYLVGHSSIMLLDLLLHVICTFLRTTRINKLSTNKKWRSSSIWIVLMGSCLGSVAMLFNSWRILTERDKTQIQKSNFGMRNRALLHSEEDAPGNPNSTDFTFELDPQCRQAHLNESRDLNQLSRWPENPIHPTKASPSPSSAMDDATEYASFEAEALEARNNKLPYESHHLHPPRNYIDNKCEGYKLAPKVMNSNGYPEQMVEVHTSISWRSHR
ncbi:hypothetical protein O181_018208 [Austropuccinia psidii MF-1]|uniref:Uncharacterized protein n=1 Tax=Austropuccinia psidii MF-1 TaxID=1389203 RepID=A0A9Q3GSH3_9BASI|nr:hypothetical protein [Austropuccinia psidii MF-1]